MRNTSLQTELSYMTLYASFKEDNSHRGELSMLKNILNKNDVMMLSESKMLVSCRRENLETSATVMQMVA